MYSKNYTSPNINKQHLKTNMHLSIISPVYEGANIVEPLVRRISKAAATITPDFEILLVEDGSKDHSWEAIKAVSQQYPQVKGIKLSRNFGQHQAITAGLTYSQGDFVAVLDCDLQDDPAFLIDLYEQIQEGYEIVFTLRKKRAFQNSRNYISKAYQSFYRLVTGVNEFYRGDVGNFSLLSRKVVNAFLQVKEQDRHYLMVLRWLGFKHTYLEIAHQERPSGKSSYNFRKLVMLGISGITSQSIRLLYLAIILGIGLLVLALISSIYYLFAPSIALLFLSLSLFSTGLIVTTIGIASIYLGKVFEESKKRPLYIVEEEC